MPQMTGLTVFVGGAMRLGNFAVAFVVMALAFSAEGCARENDLGRPSDHGGDLPVSGDTGDPTAAESAEVSASVEATNPMAGSFDSVKWQEQANKWAVDVADCLVNDGWPVKTFESDPGVTGFALSEQLPQSQNVAYSKAIEKCRKVVGPPPPRLEMTKARLSRLYDFYVDSRQCLIDRGYPLPEAPTRDSFVANFESEMWTPWGDLPEQALSNPADWEKACPQAPPPGVL